MKTTSSSGAGATKAIILSTLLLLSASARAASTVTFTAGNEIAQQNASLGVPIDVSGFTTVSSFQFTLQWDPGVLTFQSEVVLTNIGGFTSGSFGTGSVSSGKLTVSWDDPNFATDGGGVSLSDGSSLFFVNFMAVGNTGFHSGIDFVDSPTIREVTVQGGAATFLSVSGAVDVTPVPEPSLAALGLLGIIFCAARWFRTNQAGGIRN
jgi:hypothetical protein